MDHVDLKHYHVSHAWILSSRPSRRTRAPSTYPLAMRSDDRIDLRLCRLLGREEVQVDSRSGRTVTDDHSAPTMEEKRALRALYALKEQVYSRDTELGNPSMHLIRPSGTRVYISLVLISALGLSLFYLFARSPHFGPCGSTVTRTHHISEEVCPQTTAIAPERNRAILDALEEQYQTEWFKLQAYESLGGAIRVPCVVFVASYLRL